MVKSHVTDDLYDPRNGGQAIRVAGFRLSDTPFEPARMNYFSVYRPWAMPGTASPI